MAVFDDLHWAEETFLDLVEHVADWSRDAPILLLCIARAELLDARPHWGGGKLNATTVLVEPLSADESGRLLENLLGSARLDEVSRDRIAQAAEGNPLFVEEMLAMLIDDGLLVHADGEWLPRTSCPRCGSRRRSRRCSPRVSTAWTAPSGRPSSARRSRARSSTSAPSPSCPPTPRGRPSARASCRSSARSWSGPSRRKLAGEDAFRFRHLLIRDAAYEAISKELRAELHERFADWLAAQTTDGGAELDEIVGYHLEQAVSYREQLGHRDERTAALAGRAAHHLERAARRAENHDWPGRVALLTRVVGLLPPEEEARGWALIDLGDSLIPLHELTRAEAALGEALEIAGATATAGCTPRRAGAGERRAVDQARGEQGEDTFGRGAGVARVRGARRRSRAARAWERMANVHHMENRFADRELALRRALSTLAEVRTPRWSSISWPDSTSPQPSARCRFPTRSRASTRFAPRVAIRAW